MTATSDPVDPEGQERFSTLVLPEVEVMLRVALSLTLDRSDAEDLVQDTLVRAFRGIDGFDGRYPRAWVLTIMRNTHINNHRKRRPELLREPGRGEERPDARGPDTSAEAVAMAGTFDAAVEEAFLELSEEFRQVVILVDIDQLSYAEAADVMGTPVGTVMSRLHRARKRIRDHLQAHSAVPTDGAS